jgi:hypothetical protein
LPSTLFLDNDIEQHLDFIGFRVSEGKTNYGTGDELYTTSLMSRGPVAG